MLRACAWCGRELGQSEPFEDLHVTHGICPVCCGIFFPLAQANEYAPSSTQADTRKTILVAEDNATLRELLATLLQREGYAVVQASNGKEAVDYMGNGTLPDLILSALGMPVLDGQAFLNQCKQIEGTRSVPVVLLSSDDITQEGALSRGWAGFVAKPFNEDKLLDEIRRCLGPV
jgi:CheY-like chemotaxis protein